MVEGLPRLLFCVVRVISYSSHAGALLDVPAPHQSVKPLSWSMPALGIDLERRQRLQLFL